MKKRDFTPLEKFTNKRAYMDIDKTGYTYDLVQLPVRPVKNKITNHFRQNSLMGFTLTELLLAISIFSIIATVVYSTFSMGLNTWRKMDKLLERYQEVRLLLDRMGWELRNCVDMRVEDFGNSGGKFDFYGEKNRVAFFTAKENGIKRVVYQRRKDEGFASDVFRLERKEENFTPQLPAEETTGDLVLDLVKDIEFKYRRLIKDGTEIRREWQDTWKEDGSNIPPLPLQVCIGITFLVPTGRRDEYQEVTVNRYVDIVTVQKI